MSDSYSEADIQWYSDRFSVDREAAIGSLEDLANGKGQFLWDMAGAIPRVFVAHMKSRGFWDEAGNPT